MIEGKTPIEKEWQSFLKREEKWIKKAGHASEPFWDSKLQQVVPDGLSEKLEAAFYVAFKGILENGTGMIGKSFSKEKSKAEYDVRAFAAGRYPSRKNLAAVRKHAAKKTAASVAGAGAEGAVLGVLGIGLPDIPLFLAVVLRSLYALSIHFGIDYEKTEEQELLLDILAQSLSRGEQIAEQDAAMNQRIYRLVMGAKKDDSLPSSAKVSEESIRRASSALSGELLYLKFLQGVPVVGIIGGVYDGLYLKRITDYAVLKMERRWLLSMQRKD